MHRLINPAIPAMMRVNAVRQTNVETQLEAGAGTLSTVVAPPDKFTEDGEAPDVAVDEEGIVYALDYDRNMIRIFEPK